MREPQPGRVYPDTHLLESVMQEYIETVQSGRTVRLTKNGHLVAVIVPPEVAEAGLRSLGREG